MDRLADLFESVVERFLQGDLDRRTRILSWLTLILLGFSLWGGLHFSSYGINLKNPATGLERKIPLKDILFHNDH